MTKALSPVALGGSPPPLPTGLAPKPGDYVATRSSSGGGAPQLVRACSVGRAGFRAPKQEAFAPHTHTPAHITAPRLPAHWSRAPISHLERSPIGYRQGFVSLGPLHWLKSNLRPRLVLCGAGVRRRRPSCSFSAAPPPPPSLPLPPASRFAAKSAKKKKKKRNLGGELRAKYSPLLVFSRECDFSGAPSRLSFKGSRKGWLQFSVHKHQQTFQVPLQKEEGG